MILGDYLIVLGGVASTGALTGDVEVMGVQTGDTGCNPSNLPISPVRHASVYLPILNSIITCGGGLDGHVYLANCTRLNESGNIDAFPPMTSQRHDFGMVLIKNQIIAIGGWNHFGGDWMMDRIPLDETNKTWTLESTPFRVNDHCVVTLGENVIVTGGDNSQATWIYNIVNNTWTEGPRLNEKRQGHGCFADEQTNVIFVIGGVNSNGIMRSTEKWIFGTESWTSSASLPEAVKDSAAVSSRSGETIGYLVGGWTNDGTASKVWKLRRQDERWKEVDSMTLKHARWGHTVVNVPAEHIPGC